MSRSAFVGVVPAEPAGKFWRAASDKFYLVGTGIVLTAEPTASGKRAGYLSVEEGHFEGEKWGPGRRMNGDQDHQGRHVRMPGDEYLIQHVKIYTY